MPGKCCSCVLPLPGWIVVRHAEGVTVAINFLSFVRCQNSCQNSPVENTMDKDYSASIEFYEKTHWETVEKHEAQKLRCQKEQLTQPSGDILQPFDNLA